MSNEISEDCSSNLHEYCTPCECPCHKTTTDENSTTMYEAIAKLKEAMEVYTRNEFLQSRGVVDVWHELEQAIDALIAAVRKEYNK